MNGMSGGTTRGEDSAATTLRVVGPTGGLRTYADLLWWRGSKSITLMQFTRRLA